MKIREKYCLGTLLAAKAAVESGVMSAYKASKQFSVPRTTLHDNLHSKYLSNKLGTKTLLTAEEELELKTWIFECAERGFPLSKPQVIQGGTVLLRRRTSKKGTKVISANWYQRFRKRHADTSERAVSVVSRASANVSENNIRGWHSKITSYMTENDMMHILTEHPERIFNGDETGFQLAPDIKNRVLAKHGAKNVFAIASGLEKVSQETQEKDKENVPIKRPRRRPQKA